MQHIVTISGPARHGKSTTATFIKKMLEQEGRRVIILNFGDYVKFIAEKCFGYKGESYKNDPEQRKILQQVGTEIGRKYNDDFWVDIIKSTIIAFQDEFDVCLIADARFPNECGILKNIQDTKDSHLLRNPVKVVNLRVLRRNFDNGLTPEGKSHASENGLKFFEFDYNIDSESIMELEEKLLIFINKYLSTPKSRAEKGK